MLFRSTRLGFSRAQKEAILRWGKLCGISGVPTLYSLGKCDEYLKECGETPTRKFTTGMGDILYMNALQSAIRQV
jgi:hypothetical protein